MKNIGLLFVLFALSLLGCAKDPGQFGLGVREDGQSIAFVCDEHDEDSEEASDGGILGFLDSFIPSAHAVVLPRYFGYGAGSRGCYHNNTNGFNCGVSQTKKRKFIQDIKAGTDTTSVPNSNVIFGIAQGYVDIDNALNTWNLQDNTGADFRVKMGYSTGTGGGSSFASGGFDGNTTYELSNAPAKLLGYLTSPKSISDYNIDKIAKFARDCFGANPTQLQYRNTGRLVGRHETMHGLGFAHTGGAVTIMVASFACSDIPTGSTGGGGLNMTTGQMNAANAYSPGDWDDTTVLELNLEH